MAKSSKAKTGKKAKKAKKASAANAVALTSAAALLTGAGVEDAVFVIMLDDLMAVHDHHFPITEQSDDIEVLRAIGQHSGERVLIPRTDARMEFIENKDLIFTPSPSGRIDEGGIYRLTPR